jgi:hypothetical protein
LFELFGGKLFGVLWQTLFDQGQGSWAIIYFNKVLAL